MTRLEMDGDKVALASVDNIRDYSDDERAGISLWTPEVKGCPVRRQAKTKSILQRSPSFVRGQENKNDALFSPSSVSEPILRKRFKWTQEEEELLAHLKTTTTLSNAEMVSYFSKRQPHSIGQHWNLMISRGKASPISQVHTVLEPRIPLPSLSSSTDPLPFDENRPKPSDHDTMSEAKDSQIIQQQVHKGFAEVESLVQSSGKPVAHIGYHKINSPNHTSGDHRTIADDSVLIHDGVRAHIEYSTGETVSSAKDCSCKIAESAHQIHSNVFHAGIDQSYGVSKPWEIKDESSLRGKDCASKHPDQAPEAVSKHGCGAQGSSVSSSIKAEPESDSGEPFSDGIVSFEVCPQGATVIEASNSPVQSSISITETQSERSIPPTAEDTIPINESTLALPPKTLSTSLLSTTPAQPSDPDKSSASHEPNADGTSKICTQRQIVRVVIPLPPLSRNQVRCPLTTTENEDYAFNRQLSFTVESRSAALSPNLPHQERLAIRTPTQSPSVAAAESQYAASAAFVHDEIRTPLGPEVADSQPLSTMPVVATPMPEVGEDATRPIILQDESPPLKMSPGVAPLTRNELKEATKSIISECNLQPLSVTSVIATPARKPVEEATESDILESGSYPLIKPTSAARSLLKRVKKRTTARSSSTTWAIIEDCSEDELSRL